MERRGKRRGEKMGWKGRRFEGGEEPAGVRIRRLGSMRATPVQK